MTMAPATSAGATPATRKGRPARWTRDDIIEAIIEWTALYGEPPRAADWNPSAARWSAAGWRIARYRKGRSDGTPWPSLNRAKALFGGSLNAALEAAGFEPNKPGPKRRSEVTPELLERTEMAPVVRAALEAARAEARAERAGRSAAERGAAKLAGCADALREELRAAKGRPAATTTTKAKVVRERVRDDAALDRARARIDKVRAGAKVELAKARMDAAEGRRAATRAAAKLERAEATITTLREERHGLRAELDDAVRERARAEDRLGALAARLDAAHERIAEVREIARQSFSRRLKRRRSTVHCARARTRRPRRPQPRNGQRGQSAATPSSRRRRPESAVGSPAARSTGCVERVPPDRRFSPMRSVRSPVRVRPITPTSCARRSARSRLRLSPGRSACEKAVSITAWAS